MGLRTAPIPQNVAMDSSTLRMIQNASPYVDADQSRQDDFRILLMVDQGKRIAFTPMMSPAILHSLANLRSVAGSTLVG
jgi:hypothetical protein